MSIIAMTVPYGSEASFSDDNTFMNLVRRIKSLFESVDENLFFLFVIGIVLGIVGTLLVQHLIGKRNKKLG